MGVKISDAGQYFSIIGTVILLCKINECSLNPYLTPKNGFDDRLPQK